MVKMAPQHLESELDENFPLILVRLLAVRAANFQVEGSIYLQQGGRDFDLHNDYDFVEFSYSVAECVVEFSWLRSPGDCVRGELPARLLISCRGVTHLSARKSPGDAVH
jgi:hypothetical protein